MCRYDEVLTIPIIENTCFEKDLTDSMRVIMQKYPETNAVMVRRHGIYVWGDTWQMCKTMAECYHYLCEMAVELHKLGLNEFTKDSKKDLEKVDETNGSQWLKYRWNINITLIKIFDPPGHSRIGGHYFHAWCPYVRYKKTKTRCIAHVGARENKIRATPDTICEDMARRVILNSLDLLIT